MNDDVAEALANDLTIDITTTGRQSGEPRRIEIWYHRLDGRYYITGTPGHPRSWYANLLAHPEFTFHLKTTVHADLAAHADPITDSAERKRVLSALLPRFPQLAERPEHQLPAWIADSPLVEVVFTA